MRLERDSRAKKMVLFVAPVMMASSQRMNITVTILLLFLQ